jgi:membrane-bound ClpP family serine protease
MPEPEEEQTPEAAREKGFGIELLFFIIGAGFVFFGLLFILTGIGALIGIGMVVLGGLIGLFGSAVGVILEWRASRKRGS